eukprot:10116153-Ditylum_brightwellii.AAC.1
MPPTIEFMEEWLDNVKAPDCPVKQFEKILSSHQPPPPAVAMETDSKAPLAKACVIPLAFVAPLLAKSLSPTQAWP